jgi:Holliday junction resolvase
LIKSPQAKGKQWERELAKYLEKLFNCEVRRVPCSGAIHSFMSQDIICINQKSIVSELHIECKKCEKLNVWEVYEKTRRLASVGKMPIVVWTKNFAPQAIVSIGQYDFFNLLKELEDLRCQNTRLAGITDGLNNK